jgi:uncharacterized phiE125 gp8 family phage protein
MLLLIDDRPTYSLKHLSGPTTEPVSLTETKTALRLSLTATNEDDDLRIKIAAARRQAEHVLGKKIGTQVWEIYYDSWPHYGYWQLPLEPLIAVNSVQYTDEYGDVETLDSSEYSYSTQTGQLWLVPDTTWPAVDLLPFSAIVVNVTVGIQPVIYGNTSPASTSYPENIKQAILYRVGTMYNIREDVTLLAASKVPGTFDDLLSGERNIVP